MKIQLSTRNFDKQQSIFDSPATHTIVPKGRRFGLTKGAANDYIMSALKGKFHKGLWVDTVNSNIDRYIERYFMPHLKRIPENLWHWGKQEKIVKIKNAYIDFRSADRPENIEGFGYDKYFINEAGIVLKNPYLWDNAIRPMMWDFKARGVIGGTPKGKGIFSELYARGQDEEQPQYASMRFSTFDNPFIDSRVVLEEIRSMPERVVRQEIYAEFLDDTGVVFRGITQVASLSPKPVHPQHLYVIGCDLAKVQDYTVIVVYDRADNCQVMQMRFNKLEWPFVKEKVQEVSRKFNNALVVLDATGLGDPIADDLIRSGVPVEPIHLTNELKKQIIEKLSNWIELSNLKMLQLDETIQEFNNFTYDISSSGRVRYEAPVGFHDDIVIAHALAVWSMQPVIVREDESNLSIIERDVKEKIKAATGVEDILDFEAV